MAFLGVPYRILYEAAKLETGLVGVQVRILRAGGLVADGPFAMVELPAPFQGRYYYDYPNSTGYPEGDYFAFISSPGDATFTTFRFELFLPWAKAADLSAFLTALQTELDTLTAEVASLTALVTTLSTEVAALVAAVETIEVIETLIPSLVSAVVPAYIQGGVDMQTIEATVDDNALIVVTMDDSNATILGIVNDCDDEEGECYEP